MARQISKSLSERVVVARVNGEVWDLDRPLESSCRLELLDFEHPEGILVLIVFGCLHLLIGRTGKKVFWHSSAHVLGEAAERRFGCHLCIGPPVDDGFYYEMALPDGYVSLLSIEMVIAEAGFHQSKCADIRLEAIGDHR